VLLRKYLRIKQETDKAKILNSSLQKELLRRQKAISSKKTKKLNIQVCRRKKAIAAVASSTTAVRKISPVEIVFPKKKLIRSGRKQRMQSNQSGLIYLLCPGEHNKNKKQRIIIIITITTTRIIVLTKKIAITVVHLH